MLLSRQSRPSSLKNQQGSTLLVSLVILTIITMVAVFSMKQSGLQMKMVGNTQFKEMAFHAAYNETQWYFHRYENSINKFELVQAIDSKVLDPISGEYKQQAIVPGDTPDQPDHLVTNSTLIHTDRLMAPGYSIGLFFNYNFVVNSQASVPNTNSESTQDQGFRVLGPAY